MHSIFPLPNGLGDLRRPLPKPWCGRPSHAPGLVGPLGRDQASVPTHGCVGSHDGRNAIEGAAADALAFRSKSPALVVREPQASAFHLLLEDAVFFDEIGDGIGLMPVHKSGDGEQENLEGMGSGLHSARIRASEMLKSRVNRRA